MAIKAKKQGVMFMDYDDGKYQNHYNLLHEVEGAYVGFGQAVDTREGRTFFLDGVESAYSDYPAFEAAYYARFPERKANL